MSQSFEAIFPRPQTFWDTIPGPPLKFNIDTSNSHVWKEIHLKTHHLGYPYWNFWGVPLFNCQKLYKRHLLPNCQANVFGSKISQFTWIETSHIPTPHLWKALGWKFGTKKKRMMTWYFSCWISWFLLVVQWFKILLLLPVYLVSVLSFEKGMSIVLFYRPIFWLHDYAVLAAWSLRLFPAQKKMTLKSDKLNNHNKKLNTKTQKHKTTQNIQHWTTNYWPINNKKPQQLSKKTFVLKQVRPKRNCCKLLWFKLKVEGSLWQIYCMSLVMFRGWIPPCKKPIKTAPIKEFFGVGIFYSLFSKLGKWTERSPILWCFPNATPISLMDKISQEFMEPWNMSYFYRPIIYTGARSCKSNIICRH